MRLLVCAVGRLKAGPERDIAARYADRLKALGRGVALGPLDTVELDESRAARSETRRDEEAVALLTAAGGATLVALDENGATPSSEAFAARLGAWRDAGAPVVAFMIGGADGHGAAVLERAAWTVSFGRLTWPHQMVRLMVAEQLYRAATILAGHPYHRA